MCARAGIALLLAFTSLQILPAASTYYPPPDEKGGWRSLTGASEKKLRAVAGVDRTKLDEAFQLAQETTQHGGLVVVRHGYLVYEKYFGRGHRNANPDMASCGKAFTSIACGIMLQEKRDRIPQGLDTKVFTKEYLPEAFPLDDPAKAEITMGQLLTMTAGFHGEGTQSGYVHGKEVKLQPVPQDRSLGLDMSAIRYPLWCKPGEGWSYSSPSPHIASIVLRHLVGMDLKDYIAEKLGRPMQWGAWNYCLYRNGVTLPHANGAGSIALHATDALRFAYLLLHQGRWKDQQLVPAAYVALCGRPSPYNPHYPYSLEFEVNQDGHVSRAPRDAYWKSGAGGFAIYVVPSLDMVIYKLGGNDAAYDPALTRLPQPGGYDGSRSGWKATRRIPQSGVPAVLELVSAAVVTPEGR
ncbi:MAG TPA: serine hydrolase [Bryobacteraceae bacterium]|nr:serine hydrolase [Bryobacteraceae bacterium]